MKRTDNKNPFRRTLSAVFVISLGALLTLGSGGGGGDGGTLTTGQTATGVFKDSNVAGLGFSSGSENGTTGTNGTFTYVIGQDVTFTVGGVTIGTAAGAPLITPIDLVAGGTTSTTEVQNIVRFMLLLDTDGDPTNGIDISSAVQTIAENWPQIDFATGDLAAELGSIITDVSSANGSTAVLPGAGAAQAHLEGTLRCARSGAFSGMYSGTDNGIFGVLVNALTGLVSGVAVNSLDGDVILLTGNSGVAFDQQGAFIAGITSDGATFSGEFIGADDISGTWQDTEGGNGTFDGSRIGGSANAEFRFTGFFQGDAVGLFTFDVDASGNVTGIAYTAFSSQEVGLIDESIGLSGAVTGGVLNAQTDDQDGTITGTLDTVAGTLTGTWQDQEGASGTLFGSGCKLN